MYPGPLLYVECGHGLAKQEWLLTSRAGAPPPYLTFLCLAPTALLVAGSTEGTPTPCFLPLEGR